MKAPKIIFAGLLALSMAGVAQAQTVIHITGSTAFRNAAVSAITNILQPGFTFGYSGTSFTGANQAIFTGKAITNDISVIIKTSWSGAAGGVQTVVQQLPITTWLTNTTAQSTGGPLTLRPFTTRPHRPMFPWTTASKQRHPYLTAPALL